MAEISSKTELQRCFYYEREIPPTVEIRKLEEGYEEEIVFRKNEVVFITEGEVCVTFRNYPEKALCEGEFIFIPVGGTLRYTTVKSTRLTIIRPNGCVKLCGGCLIEDLYRQGEKQTDSWAGGIYALTMNRPLRLFLEGLNEAVGDGLNCRYYFDIKAQEMLVLLKAYYSREELRCFFALILTPNTSFSELVRANHHKYATVKELANAMNMTPKLFSRKFAEVFGESTINWMQKERALRVYTELYSGRESIAQIADKYNFSSQPHLNKFCKKEFGKNPGEIRRGG